MNKIFVFTVVVVIVGQLMYVSKLSSDMSSLHLQVNDFQRRHSGVIDGLNYVARHTQTLQNRFKNLAARSVSLEQFRDVLIQDNQWILQSHEPHPDTLSDYEHVEPVDTSNIPSRMSK